MGIGPGTCGMCHQSIIYGITPARKSLPVNPEPDPAGNVHLTYDDEQLPRARVLRKNETCPDPERFMTHYATCPVMTRQRRTVRGFQQAAQPQPLDLPTGVVDARARFGRGTAGTRTRRKNR